MDIQMPEMDGYEATRVIRNELKNDIPIIALTASVIRSDIDKCLEAGMNSYVSKPFSDTELLSEIARLLGRTAVSGGEYNHSPVSGLVSPPLQDTRVNFTHLKTLVKNDQEKVSKYLHIFLDLVPKRIESIEQAISIHDWTTVRKIVHSMKPQLSSLGLFACKRLADDIEVNYHRQDKLETDVNQFTSLCKEAVGEVENEIQNIS
jgi:response regulator RpfG family c-di-GMP phosphodiesterase